MNTNHHMIEIEDFRHDNLKITLQAIVHGTQKRKHRPSLLWLEDEVKDIEAARYRFEQWGMKVTTVERYNEAYRLFTAKNFDVVLVDLRLGRYDHPYNRNGVTFIGDIRKKNQSIPIFVYSAFLHDKGWQNKLKDSSILMGLIDKPIEADPSPIADGIRECIDTAIELYSRHYVWFTLDKRVTRYTFSWLKKQKTEKIISIRNSIWEKNQKWTSRYLVDNGKAWMIIVGDEVLVSDRFDNYPGDSAIMRIGNAVDAIPIIFTAEPVVEESSWRKNTRRVMGKSDWYPSMRLWINKEKCVEDFDTGAEVTHVTESIAPYDPLIHQLERGSHNGVSHMRFLTDAEVSVRSDGESQQMVHQSLPLFGVSDWPKTGFCRIAAGRRALIGRDLFHYFDMQVILDGVKRKTRLKF